MAHAFTYAMKSAF